MRTEAVRAEHRGMTRRPLISSLVLAAAVAGCGGSSSGGGHNKAGAATQARPQTVEIQATDASSPEAQHFAKQIEAHSNGTLTVKVRNDYPAGTPANEARLASDIRAGEVDFGVLPARAWAPAGVKAFDALQAPFVLGSYDVAREAIAGPAGSALKQALEKAGVKALGLVPAELRRVLSVRPLATPDAFRGMSIRIADNDTSAAVLRSLGATPVEDITAEDVTDRLKGHALSGAETAPIFALGNGYGTFAKYITGYALFDRVDTLVASPNAWKRLSSSQQAAVTAAAKDTIAYTSTLPKREDDNLAELCRSGVRVTQPTEGQLAALADATEPVRTALRGNDATGPVLKALEATPGAGPQALEAPSDCSKPVPARVVAKAGPASIPNGTYTVRDTVADFERWGQYGDEWSVPITFTHVLKDGRWRGWQKPDFGVEPVASGTYEVKGDLATFTFIKPVGNTIPPFTVRWSYYRGRLTWEPVEVSDLGLRIIFGAHPWKKVG
jgi:TRAP-type C4-dicarboxylate transport system substrate-binding protein